MTSSRSDRVRQAARQVLAAALDKARAEHRSTYVPPAMYMMVDGKSCLVQTSSIMHELGATMDKELERLNYWWPGIINADPSTGENS